MKTVTVRFPDHTYDIHIQRGILHNLKEYLPIEKTYIMITDTNIPMKYRDIVETQLSIKKTYVFPSGEHSKSFFTIESIINNMVEDGITRDTIIIALGGGVVGDIAGFIASIYVRGIPFVQIPTSLLAQIDSSIGGKVGINTSHMKNAVGSFHQPQVVLVDPDTLSTLTKRHLNNGMAELIKHALICGKSLYLDILNNDPYKNIDEWIYQSIQIKKDIVVQDEFDKGERQILNFGHTIGHALEQYSDYSLYHGEAVALGIVMMTKNTMMHEDVLQLFNKYDLPTTYEYDKEKLFQFMKVDKKIAFDILNVVRLEQPGIGFLEPISINKMKDYL